MKKITGVIFLKDRQDAIKASEIFESMGIPVWSSPKAKEKFINSDKELENNFMMHDGFDEGWRIQSHYLGNGISVDEFDERVNDLHKKHPTLKEDLIDYLNKRKELQKQLEEINNLLGEDNGYLSVINDNLKESN